MSSHPPADSTAGLGLPQVAACLLVGYFVFRWFFKSTDPSTTAQRPSPVDPRRLQEQVDVIRGMFPQIPAGAVQAELIRNGGNIEITTEKILTNGFLPEPPAPTPPALVHTPAPRPPIPTQRRAATPATSSASGSSTILSQYSDLITRYNLHNRLHETESAPSIHTQGGKGKAPATKSDRQLAHHNKRDDMILAARRRMQEMDRKAAVQS